MVSVHVRLELQEEAVISAVLALLTSLLGHAVVSDISHSRCDDKNHCNYDSNVIYITVKKGQSPLW